MKGSERGYLFSSTREGRGYTYEKDEIKKKKRISGRKGGDHIRSGGEGRTGEHRKRKKHSILHAQERGKKGAAKKKKAAWYFPTRERGGRPTPLLNGEGRASDQNLFLTEEKRSTGRKRGDLLRLSGRREKGRRPFFLLKGQEGGKKRPEGWRKRKKGSEMHSNPLEPIIKEEREILPLLLLLAAWVKRRRRKKKK